MGVKVKGIASLTKRLNNIEQSYADDAVLKLAGHGMTLVKEHTLKGRDKNGRVFKPYHKGSKKTGRVDLFDRGDMFRAMSFKKISSSKAIIYFTRTEEAIKAFDHQTGRHVPKRAFFGLQQNEQKKLSIMLKKIIAKAIK